MFISTHGLEEIKKSEGLRYTAYQDTGGVWTIGYGHTGYDVFEGVTITRSQAEDYLYADLRTAEQAVNSYHLLYHWSQNEFDALVSFTYNCGAGNLSKLVKNGDRTKLEIATALLLYCKDSTGTEITGLKNRREREMRLFLTPDEVYAPDIITPSALQTIVVDNNKFSIPCVKINGSNYAMLRGIASILGYSVAYNKETDTPILKKMG